MFVKDLFQTLKEAGLMFILFCFVLYTSTYGVNVYFLVPFCLLVIIFCRIAKYFDGISFWLGLFSVFYSAIVVVSKQAHSYFDCVGYLIAPVSFYCFGKFIGGKCKIEGHLLILLFLVVLVYPLNLYVGGIHDIMDFGVVNVYRSFSLSGRGENGSATMFALNLALGFVGFTTFFSIKRPMESFWAWGFLVVAILSMMINLHLLNRTCLVVAALCILIVSAYLSKNNLWRFVAIISILVLLLFLLFKLGVIDDEIIEGYEMRNQDVEKLKTGNGRTNRWGDALRNIFLYPFGWAQNPMVFNKYVHNLWLDIARVAGIFPFACFLMATLKSIRYVLKLFGGQPNATNATLIGLNVCLYTSSFVEPVMEGFPIHMYLICFLWGVQKSYYYCKEDVTENL